MNTFVSHNVANLSEASRENIEELLGAKLEANQRIYIVVDAPLSGPSQAKRTAAAQRIASIISQAQAHADSRGIPDAEIDAAVEEAMAHVRGR